MRESTERRCPYCGSEEVIPTYMCDRILKCKCGEMFRLINQDDQHEGGTVKPPTMAQSFFGNAQKQVSSDRPPSPFSRLKSKTIAGRGLMWAHKGTIRFLIRRKEE